MLEGKQVQSRDIVLGATEGEGGEETRALPPPAVRPRDLVHAACTLLCQGSKCTIFTHDMPKDYMPHTQVTWLSSILCKLACKPVKST